MFKKYFLSIGIVLALFATGWAQPNGAQLNTFFQSAGSDDNNWYVDVMEQAGTDYVTNNTDYGSSNAMGSWTTLNLRFTILGITASTALASSIQGVSSQAGISTPTPSTTFLGAGNCYPTEPAFNISFGRAAPAADAGATAVAIARLTFPKSSFPTVPTLSVRTTTGGTDAANKPCSNRETFWTNPGNVFVNGIATGRQLVSSTPTVLPLKLSSFTATAQSAKINAALLNWSATDQVNTSSFEVERSTDSKNYSKIGTVAAAGTSAGKQTYSFTDANAQNGTNTYRLKMVDIDGKFTYGPVRAVRFDGTAIALQIMPNPTQNVCYVKGLTQPAVVKLMDMNGKVLLVQNGITSTSPLNIASLPRAVYLVQVTQNGQTSSTLKLIKE